MNPTRIAIAGLGAIGRTVARRLTDGLPGLSLACIATGNADKGARASQNTLTPSDLAPTWRGPQARKDAKHSA